MHNETSKRLRSDNKACVVRMEGGRDDLWGGRSIKGNGSTGTLGIKSGSAYIMTAGRGEM